MRAAEWIHQYRPRTLLGKLLLMSLVVVAVPIAVAGTLVEREGRHALLEEKAAKLFGLTKILDANLADAFDAVSPGPGGDREALIRSLNLRLAPFTDRVAAASPGVGVGYYSSALNAIVTYGPSTQYGNTVGTPIPPEHPGWRVLASGHPALETGNQVRGLIMNAMTPIVRDGRVLGYIWANELSDDVERQADAMDRAVIGVSAAGILLGLGLAHAMSRRLSRDVKAITGGLAVMRRDLHHRIPQPSGEIGEIAEEVNGMAQALLDARSLTENILQSIVDGVIAVDQQARVTSINPAAQQLFGVTAEVVGRPYQSLMDQGADFSSPLLDTLRTGRKHVGVALDFPLPGHTLHLNVSSSLLRDSHGDAIGAVVVFKDMTEQRRLRTQIMRADRLAALGELTAGVAHEIRNPLTSIRGFMQLLESSDDVAEWQRYAPIIVRQVDSLNRIVTELLDFGRPRPPSIRPIQLNDVIHEVSLLAGRKSSAQLVLDLAPGLPLVNADGEALKQAVLNLIINAVQAIPDSGTVRIATAAGGAGEAVVTVADDGVGIAAENLEKVFDPFFTTKAEGTGLGLAMVHRIVDAHGGTISIASTPGTGTIVTVRLPLAQDTGQDTEAHA